MKMHLDQCTSRKNLHPKSLNEKKKNCYTWYIKKLLQINPQKIQIMWKIKNDEFVKALMRMKGWHHGPKSSLDPTWKRCFINNMEVGDKSYE